MVYKTKIVQSLISLCNFRFGQSIYTESMLSWRTQIYQQEVCLGDKVYYLASKCDFGAVEMIAKFEMESSANHS